MSSSNNGVHILVFPYPAQGHIIPLLDLTHQLSLRGLTITILITPKNLPILTPLLSSNPSIQTLVLPFPPDPSIPPGVENVKDLGIQGAIPIITALRRLQDPIIQWFKSHSNPPVAILYDFFLGWTHHLAQQIGIPGVTFYCTSAFLMDLANLLWSNPEAVKPWDEIKLHDLPRAPSFAWYQIPSMFRRYRESSDCNEKARFEEYMDSILSNGLSWASIYNTFGELEGEFLDYFREKVGHSRVYAVGPLTTLVGGPNGSNDDDVEVISWLDQWDDGSVLYVCFGSQKLLKKAQMEALAVGLERSGVRFVWVVKPLTAQQVEDGYGFLPDGFEDRVMDLGFVIKGWAPQKSILSHRAVGGFLSHCGWNSTLEAIAASTMILGWPMEADQFVNAKLLVEYEGAAVVVCVGEDTVPDSNELARKITESMKEDRIERVRAKELGDKSLEAIKVGGSSHRGLDELVQELDQLKLKNV